MRKIDKNFENVPPSLNSNLTNQRREELKVAEKWINKNVYLSRYKTKDVKEELNNIYYNKCAYCESRVEELHVEHFRPKKTYYWLAYSWDNLLLCCPTCNKAKSNNFEVENQVSISQFDISDIHNLAIKYNKFENNKIVNPEIEDLADKTIFSKNGEISSADDRVNKTIITCKLNRQKLIEFRKPIYDTFEKEIISR